MRDRTKEWAEVRGFLQLKSVSEVLGKLLDSRTSYIASVNMLQRAG